ncbi:MAG: 16S rRNA (cytidine(1402)-2'-O)-methyltransferase [Chromatiales bacterium]
MSTKTGTLYLVATPIGNLEDISARALRILREADLVLAEDTRVSTTLLRHFGISTPLAALHAHNERARSASYLEMLRAGKRIALISDAGTPLISDPGFLLVRSARSKGLSVVPVPGACAAVAAVSASGLPCDRFAFEGFLPPSEASRRRALQRLRGETRTMIFFEAPHRVAKTMVDLISAFGSGRKASLARELTKLHETIITATLGEIAAALAHDPNQSRGEIVLCVGGAARDEPDMEEGRCAAAVLYRYLSAGQAAAAAAEITGVSRKRLYESLSKSPDTP